MNIVGVRAVIVTIRVFVGFRDKWTKPALTATAGRRIWFCELGARHAGKLVRAEGVE